MKIAILGLGSIGQRHFRNLEVLGHDVQSYDPKQDKPGKRAAAIKRSDAVVIASPSGEHHHDLLDSIDAGKHVFVEKPIAISTSSCQVAQEAVEKAKDKSLVVMTGTNLRFHPCVMQAKRWMDAGIGHPIWAHFCCAQATEKPLYLSDGVILNTGSHEVDMALYLLGPAKMVYADANLHDFAHAEDIADFMLLHESGCKSTFHLDFVCSNPIREAWIVSEGDRIGMDLIGRRASLNDKVESYPGNFDGDYFTEMGAFIDRIEGKDTLGASGDDGLATLQVLLDVRRKALS